MKSTYSLKKATIINAAGKYSKIILQIIVEVILARLLTPHDYGIVAVVTVFITFFTILSDIGLSTAIVQIKSLTKDDINNIYTFTVYLSIGLMVAFALFSYGIASFYENKVYIKIGQLLSISLLFDSLNMVPNGILNRNKEFVTIAFRTVIVYVLSVIVTIVLAFLGFSYYALVFQAILSSSLTFIWNFVTTKPKFKLKYDNSSLKKVASYSSYQFAFNLLNYFSRNLDNLLTGKFIGSTQLGYYNKSYSLMQYPVGNLTGIITPVLHPILSDYQDAKEIMYRKYMKVVKLLASVGIYAEAICIFAAPEIINIMYGSKWDNSVLCFQLLAISIATQIINSSTGAICQALGNTRLLFITGCINTSVTVLSILFGVFIGKTIYSVALWVSISFVLNFIVSFYLLIVFGFRFSFWKFVQELAPYIVIAELVAIAIVVYPLFNINVKSMFISLIIKGIYVTIIYFISLVVTKQFKFLYTSLFK
ncbi:lipopolysaccharide biosynthesis protein [Lactobacillus amylovorus]|uniref:lipopolysaccharide biosynthesis protein n=1 Tax=Lactobacillus amylovorus TaxID=1604 RepID=UPI00233105FB|nr:lipopolysaccharide biosynthesis protein [Lactobacillus amylovorus]MDB6223318.1 lipopolysaccharide biosynthesis protein [Lactobacillus amylovorus]